MINPLTFLLVILHVLVTLFQPTAFAQSISDISNGFPDLEEMSFAGDDQYSFTVEAWDDGTVESVILVYKFEDDTDFRQLPMQRNQLDNLYSVQVPDNDQRSGRLLYYFVATDNDGNINTEGFLFSPLERQITSTDLFSNENPALPASAQLDDAKTDIVPASKVNLLYIVLGALTVGALAGLADSGGGDPGPPVEDSVTITVPLP